MLSSKSREKAENIILYIAIGSFLIHLAVIFLTQQGLLDLPKDSEFLNSPIAAIYTPFSFILIYEVYLLIYYLPKSITTYIAKQYEIMTFIIIRRLFYDLSNLELSSNWFQIKDDIQFTFDIIASLVLFVLIFIFDRLRVNSKGDDLTESPLSPGVMQFIKIKKVVAFLLVPLVFIMAMNNLFTWSIVNFLNNSTSMISMKDVNNIFFDEFFTLLIMVDVVLLLFSLFHTNEFHKIIRNSGFVISTILIRLSFSTTGLINVILVVSAVVFGILILLIHNQFENYSVPDKKY